MFVLLSKTSQLWWLWSVSLNKFVLVVSIWSQMSYNSRVRFYSNANEFFDHKYSNLVIWWKKSAWVLGSKLSNNENSRPFYICGPPQNMVALGSFPLPTLPMLKSAPGRGASSAVSVNCLLFIGRSRCYQRRSPEAMTGFESLILSNKSFWVCRLLFFLTCHLYIFEALSGIDLRNHHTEVIFRA